MKILITICARGGSKGIKNKNIKLLNGIPLIAHTIRQAIDSNLSDKVIVSTDSTKIAAISKKYGALIPFIRPSELATDEIGKIPVLRHCLNQCEKLYNEVYDIIIDLQPTSPLRRKYDIKKALEIFLNKKPETFLSVVRASDNPYFNLLEKDNLGYFSISKKIKTHILRRQDTPAVYAINGSIYIYSAKYLKNNKNNSSISNKTLIYEMDKINSIDIDDRVDFQFAEYLIKSKLYEY